MPRQFFAGATGSEPFSGGRPVKSILPHIVKGQHRGTRLEKASLTHYYTLKRLVGTLHTSTASILYSGTSCVGHRLKYATQSMLVVLVPTTAQTLHM